MSEIKKDCTWIAEKFFVLHKDVLVFVEEQIKLGELEQYQYSKTVVKYGHR